ncbi:DUF4113 domain-containing protein [Ectopseudomonas mendocina]|uniref:DUF4113 domain-containing protein n=2 Tax=Ectopseudomonas mendocina TaxID=300 RepID=A0ABD7RPY9_ECTME|nr:DUF4113 domain-containing protein [Pseudomonas mendocina]TRO10528.1 DUF4113 domain-containing protein [Pseudomonas mendocina]
MSAINGHWGRGTLKPGRMTNQLEWSMRRQMLLPANTTRWPELMVVRTQ